MKIMEIQNIISKAEKDLAMYEGKLESAKQSVIEVSKELGYDHMLTLEEAKAELEKAEAELAEKDAKLAELLNSLESITTGQYE